MLNSVDHATSRRRQENQSTKNHKQPEAYITNNRHEKYLHQNNARIAPTERTYAEATKFGKKTDVIGNSHLNGTKRNTFQKLFIEGEHALMIFEVIYLRD